MLPYRSDERGSLPSCSPAQPRGGPFGSAAQLALIAARPQPLGGRLASKVLILRRRSPGSDDERIKVIEAIPEGTKQVTYLGADASLVRIELPRRIPGRALAGKTEERSRLLAFGQCLAGDTEQLCDLSGVKPIAHDLSPPCGRQHLPRRASTEPDRLLIIELPQERRMGSQLLDKTVGHRFCRPPHIGTLPAKIPQCFLEGCFRGLAESRLKYHRQGLSEPVGVARFDLTVHEPVAHHLECRLSNTGLTNVVGGNVCHENVV